MAGQQWVSLLTPNNPQASGAGAVLNTATTQTISAVRGDGGGVAQVSAPGQYQGWYNGMLVRLTARGFITTTATSTTATFLVTSRVGNAGSTYVTLATSAGLTTGTGAVTGIQWKLEGLIRCTNVATSGNTLSTQCDMHFYNPAAQTIGTTAWGIDLCLPNASGEATAAVDTTQVQGIEMRATLAGANATIQLTQWLAETLN